MCPSKTLDGDPFFCQCDLIVLVRADTIQLVLRQITSLRQDIAQNQRDIAIGSAMVAGKLLVLDAMQAILEGETWPAS